MAKFFNNYSLLFFSCLVILTSCKSNDTASAEEETPEVRTPVTVTSMSYDPLQEFIELNATSSFLQQSFVKSNLNGYVKNVNIKIGDYVKKGQTLFVLKTKEAEAIGEAVNRLNPDFKFSGINSIHADASGFIVELNHQPGDYVQDADQLAVISDAKSFAFVMNVPYEDKPYVSIGKQVEVTLPDDERLLGIIASSLPRIDSISQTQSFAVRVNTPHSIPENLVVKVKIVKVAKTTAATLPKQSVLSDETLSEFWVMKMINDTTAVKVPVKKGIESGDRVEILSPDFSPKDKILLTGNYGLADTALVTASPDTASPSPSRGGE
ncbi:MAG: efflux RND transporter periplasmic adaptor subunit [Ginsengibacter sp.]